MQEGKLSLTSREYNVSAPRPIDLLLHKKKLSKIWRRHGMITWNGRLW
jgi:hypothetical protein